MKNLNFFFFFLLLLFSSALKYSIDPSFIVFEDPTSAGLAFAEYEESLETTGWDKLIISSSNSKNYTDFEKAYAMGYLEGVLTNKRIFDVFQNFYSMNFYYEKEGKMPFYLIDFFEKQRIWIQDSYLNHKNEIYWQTIWALQIQLEGLIDGYNSAAGPEKQISYPEFQIMAADGDLPDLLYIDPNHRHKYEKMTAEELDQKMELNLHCSSLIKLAPDFSDIYFGHNTWTTYTSMIRIFKEYKYEFSKIPIKSKTITFSSHPGTLSSNDDYFLTSANLAVMETTNPVFNTDLYDLIQPQSLLYWHRMQTANLLSDNGEEWVRIFSEFNSGTYNNQNIVLDLKKIDTVKGIIRDGTLWIAEQIPGKMVSEDVTNILKYGYWPSYNVPYFKEIRKISGVDKYIELHPELRVSYDYNHCYRANIMRRDQGKITNYEEFKSFLRYNDYKNDPFSLKNPKFSIASRNDLNLSQLNCTGAIDAKASSYQKVFNEKGSSSIIAGPSFGDYIPAFEWKDANCLKDPRYKIVGMPEKYDFVWEEYYPKYFEEENRKVRTEQE